MTIKKLTTLGRTTALISFLIGTILFGLYYFTSNDNLLYIGLGYVFLAGATNIIILFSILIRSAKDKANRRKLLVTGGIMLLNVPVMLTYFSFVMLLLETMRITFTNETGTSISNIEIVGCGGGHIDSLKPGESMTIWVKITGDCSLTMSYLTDGKRQEETIAGYITSGMGQKIVHSIDGKDKDFR